MQLTKKQLKKRRQTHDPSMIQSALARLQQLHSNQMQNSPKNTFQVNKKRPSFIVQSQLRNKEQQSDLGDYGIEEVPENEGSDDDG